MPIYLDNNATTRPLDTVARATTRVLTEEYANPSSLHRPGQRVRHCVEHARSQVAGLINADPKELVFTSGGTESVNLAIRGTLESLPSKRHLVTSAVEHSAVRRLAAQLDRQGYRVDEVGVDSAGRLDLGELEDKLTEQTALVSLIHANNETGVLLDARQACAIAARHGVRVHLDAVQSAGKIPLDVAELPADLLSMSAHKLHGPKGVGVLYVRKRTRISPILFGGRQERDLRPGTENVPAIIGYGVACGGGCGVPTKRQRDDPSATR